MRLHLDSAWDRVYAVAKRSKFIGLFISALMCAKAIVAISFASQDRGSGRSTTSDVPSRVSHAGH